MNRYLTFLILVATLVLGTSETRAGVMPQASPAKQMQNLLAQSGYQSVLTEFADAATPLVDYASLNNKTGACTAGPPKTRAILVGSNDYGPEHPRLLGPENDLDIVQAGLVARSSAEVTTLRGPAATRENVAQAFEQTLADLNCGDLVVLYYTGGGGRLSVPDGDEAGRGPYFNTLFRELSPTDPEYPAAATANRIFTARAAYPLAGGTQTALRVMTATDITDFVTNVRNRQADVVVILDTCDAGSVDLADQERAADTLGDWSLGGPQPAYDGTPLLPKRGAFAAYYASSSDEPAVEQPYPPSGGSSVIHGVFSFAVAEALQDPSIQTARDLAEHLDKVKPVKGHANDFNAEGSDPGMRVFGRTVSLQAEADAIVLSSPELTRGMMAVETPAVDVAGSINWTSPVRTVLIDGDVANVDGNGRFSAKVPLQNGANPIKIVALMQDDRILTKAINVVFNGDEDTLKGTGQRYALIIANQDYPAQSGLQTLTTPLADADALGKELTQHYGFKTELALPNGTTQSLLLRDATQRDITMALFKLSQVAGDNDTVLIYYGGHGVYEDATKLAFWMPSDAVVGVPPTYLAASQISEAIDRIQALKLIVISDSCFSGDLFRSDTPPIAEDGDHMKMLLAMAQDKSRVLITSGGNQPVRDTGGDGHSIFAQALLYGLEHMQPAEFTAQELFSRYILPAVTSSAQPDQKPQEPQFRTIGSVGHMAGDVIFVRSAG